MSAATWRSPSRSISSPPRAGASGRGAAHPARQQHVRLAARARQQVEELEDEADVPPPQRRQVALGRARHVDPAELDAARLRPVEPAEQVQQRRLAAPGAAEHGDDLARLDLEIGAVEHPPRDAALAEGLDEPAGAHHRHTVNGTAAVQSP